MGCSGKATLEFTGRKVILGRGDSKKERIKYPLQSRRGAPDTSIAQILYRCKRAIAPPETMIRTSWACSPIYVHRLQWKCCNNTLLTIERPDPASCNSPKLHQERRIGPQPLFSPLTKVKRIYCGSKETIIAWHFMILFFKMCTHPHTLFRYE